MALNCIKELGIVKDRVNIKGGGIAIGLPLGATGARLIGTLARILNEKGARMDVQALAVVVAKE